MMMMMIWRFLAEKNLTCVIYTFLFFYLTIAWNLLKSVFYSGLNCKDPGSNHALCTSIIWEVPHHCNPLIVLADTPKRNEKMKKKKKKEHFQMWQDTIQFIFKAICTTEISTESCSSFILHSQNTCFQIFIIRLWL